MSGNCGLRHAILCAMNSVTEFSPAKINLLLAVTGCRADGYHDLVSVVAPLDFGDELVAESCARAQNAIVPPPHITPRAAIKTRASFSRQHCPIRHSTRICKDHARLGS